MTLPTIANDTPRMDPLAALFLRYRNGDVEALGEVFDRTAPQLLRLAMHLTHRGADAEDLLQATFVLAMRKATAFEANRPLLPWLCALLAGQAANANRALRRRRDEPLPELISGDLTPTDAAARAELVAMLRSGVDTLSPEQRQVLLLQLQHGLSPTEIAEVLDVPPGAVRMRLHRGLEALRRLLPAGLALWLGALLPSRGLAMVRTAVMQRAGTSATTIGGATALGGMVLMKKLLLGVAVLLLGLLWWQDASDPTLAAPPAASAVATSASGAIGRAPDSADADPARDVVRMPAAATLGTLRVRVRSSSADAGLPGVPVLAWRGEGERPPLDGSATSVRTDAAGEAVFAALAPGVWHCAPGEAFAMPAQTLHVANAEATADFTVVTHTLRGAVVDDRGVPVAKATIHLSSLRGMDFSPMGERSSRPDLRLRIGARSGDDGSFACEIREDEDRVGAQHLDFATSCSHLTRANLVDEVRLILRPKRAPVVGMVVDSLGKPIADALVACLPVDHTGSRQRTVDGTWQGAPLPICMRTDAVGIFRCDATLPGKVLVWAIAPGKREGRGFIDPAAEPDRIVEVVLLDALTVTGFVRHADGTPAPDVVIHAARHPDVPGTYETRITHADGSFGMEQLPASGFWLLLGHQQLPLLSQQIPPTSGVVHVELVLPRTYLLQGRVLDPEGRGVPDCNVTANLLGPQRYGYHVSADAQGRFTMPGLPNGRVRVEASVWGDPDSDPAIVQEDASPLDGELILRMPADRLSRCSAVERIVDSSGSPVGGATVRMEWEGSLRLPLEMSSATDGTFRFDNLPARSFLLRVDRADPPARTTRPIDLTGGKQLELGNIALPPSARLAIEFVRSDGSPWRGMRPEFSLRRDNGWCHDRLEWTPHGFIAWLEPGRIRLRIDEPGLMAPETELDLTAGEVRSLRIAINIGRSKDLVFRGDGKEPIDPNDVLHATLTDSNGTVQTLVTRRSPHGDGHWHLSRTLPYGTYQITAYTDSGARYAGSFTAEDSLTDPSRVEVPSTR